jgi:hypothetical protein
VLEDDSRQHSRAVNLAAFTPSCLVKTAQPLFADVQAVEVPVFFERYPESLLNVSLIPLGCRGNVSRTATLVAMACSLEEDYCKRNGWNGY